MINFGFTRKKDAVVDNRGEKPNRWFFGFLYGFGDPGQDLVVRPTVIVIEIKDVIPRANPVGPVSAGVPVISMRFRTPYPGTTRSYFIGNREGICIRSNDVLPVFEILTIY